jgi:hypothetical protein
MNNKEKRLYNSDSFGSEQNDANYIDTCDLNRDGVINATDYSIVLYNFEKCGEAPFKALIFFIDQKMSITCW